MDFLSDHNVAEVEIPGQRLYNGKRFPTILKPLQPTCSLTNWIESNKELIYKKLLDSRAILFRGFPVVTPQDFHDVIDATGLKSMEYIGGAAVRTRLTSRVFTANESPSSENIPFHHEMSQVPDPPTHLLFFCLSPPDTDGETPILISEEIINIMTEKHPEFMREIEREGVRYIRVMSEEDDPSSAIGRGWRSTYQTDDRVVAEEKLREQGCTWEWDYLAPGNLRTVTAILPAVRDDYGEGRTQTKAFFNSMVAAYTGWNDSRNRGEEAVILGNGARCNAEAIDDAVCIMNDVCVAIPWERGDVLLVDNRTVMHARRFFSGDRRILASLIRDPTH